MVDPVRADIAKKQASDILLEHEKRISSLESDAQGWKKWGFISIFGGVFVADMFINLLIWLATLLLS